MPGTIALNCDVTTLNKNGKCFACLSQKENQAAIVYFLTQILAAKSGAAALTVGQLRNFAACFCTPADQVADNLDVAVVQAGAILKNPALSTQTIAQIRNAIKGFANTSLSEMRNMEILLRCSLNAFL